jgi:hypothetical protein
MLPQALPSGLYWKNRWYSPSYQTSPLGSFIQLRAGVKWKVGRMGSPDKRNSWRVWSGRDVKDGGVGFSP